MNEYSLLRRHRNTEFKLKYSNENKVEDKVAVLDIDLYEGNEDPERGRKFKLNINVLNKDNLHEKLDNIEKLDLFPIEYIWYAKNNDEYENIPREYMRNVGRGTRWLDLCTKLDAEVYLVLNMEKFIHKAKA